MFITLITVLIFLIILVAFITVLQGAKSLAQQKLASVTTTIKLPSVSIIVSALNEAETIEAGLSSLCALDYPNLEIIAINDRSTDATGKIIDRFAAKHSNVTPVHISQLPDNWLGKNHALHKGIEMASGEYVLLTDADIVMQPDTLKKSMQHCVMYNVDHLVLSPYMHVKTFFNKVMMMIFWASFMILFRPWRASDPNSSASVGMGAFNLVKKSAYQAIGGLANCKMQPLDDVMLGKMLKQHGYRQQLVDGIDLIAVEWYPSARAMIKGLEKNLYAAYSFNPIKMLAVILSAIVLLYWPIAGLFVTQGWVFLLNCVSLLLLLTIYAGTCHGGKIAIWHCFFYPVGVALMIYAMINAFIKNQHHGGIYWRDTFYSLKKLRDDIKKQ